MTDTEQSRFLWLLAAAALVIGTGLTFHAVRLAWDVSSRLDRKNASLQQLKSLQRDLQRGNAAVAATRQQTAASPSAINDLVRDSFAGVRLNDPKDTRKDAVQGWVIRQKIVSIPDGSVGQAMEFAHKAEKMTPPWRLTHLSVISSAQSPGVAKLDLTIESVEPASAKQIAH